MIHLDAANDTYRCKSRHPLRIHISRASITGNVLHFFLKFVYHAITRLHMLFGTLESAEFTFSVPAMAEAACMSGFGRADPLSSVARV
jgi:hypothetical protein